MKTVKFYTEEDLKELVRLALDRQSFIAKKVTFSVTENTDERSGHRTGYTLECQVEVEEPTK